MAVAKPVTPLVVDCSVIVKWELPDEDHVAQAMELLSDWQADAVLLEAPDQLPSEIGSTFPRVIRRGRQPETLARVSMGNLLAVPYRLHASGPLVPFPFSDLSQSRLRPAVVLAEVGRGDAPLCQITRNPYSDSRAVTLAAADFLTGSLPLTSYARPGKLFTAHRTLMVNEVGRLQPESLARIVDAVVNLLRAVPPSSAHVVP